MTRAETYDDLARLERLLDEYYQVSTLDPAKLPGLRAQIWELCERAALDHDLDRRGQAPGEDDFDDFLLHLDGYLCELKDAQIRGGLHTLGLPPEGDAEIDLLAALLRLPQGPVPSLRTAVADELGLELGALLAEPGRRLDPAERVGEGKGCWVTASDALDAVDALPGPYTLELSSPGVERPLRRPSDFRRFAGTTISVKSHDPVDGARRHRGLLLEADDSGIVLEVDGQHRRFSYDAIASARTVFEWGPAPKPTGPPKRAAKERSG
jgi:hypothetical protein